MKIYHYTSIETLALILANKTIRFNRLDKVDDLEESEYGISDANIKIGQYNFVSCWTKDDIENITLWGLYTQYKGVRISLDEDMFVTYPSLGRADIKSYFKDFELGSDYMTTCVNNEAKLIDVEYVKDLKAINLEIGKYQEDIGTGKSSLNYSNKYGVYKREQWSFQKESRFKIHVLPITPNLQEEKEEPFIVLSKAMSSIGDRMLQRKSISINHIDIPLKDEVFKEMEIMLGPQTTQADRIIVESLIHMFQVNSEVKNSVFKNKIRQKGTF